MCNDDEVVKVGVETFLSSSNKETSKFDGMQGSELRLHVKFEFRFTVHFKASLSLTFDVSLLSVEWVDFMLVPRG